jgi:hypothetical protein
MTFQIDCPKGRPCAVPSAPVPQFLPFPIGFRASLLPSQFWCEVVQPAVRKATGRDDIWGIGLAMSVDAYETWLDFRQFMKSRTS